jgi:hypothetical protein
MVVTPDADFARLLKLGPKEEAQPLASEGQKP